MMKTTTYSWGPSREKYERITNAYNRIQRILAIETQAQLSFSFREE
jgi:hypothetical protein